MKNFIDAMGALMMHTVTALNEIDTQAWAIFVLIIGCLMLVICKSRSIDTDIAAGVVGVAANMLTGQSAKKVAATIKENITTNG